MLFSIRQTEMKMNTCKTVTTEACAYCVPYLYIIYIDEILQQYICQLA